MWFHSGRLHGGRLRLPAALAMAAAVLATACGAPTFTYVTNSADGAYVRIPAAWAPVDEAELASAIGLDPTLPLDMQGMWIEGYDAGSPPSVTHVLGPHASAPAVLVAVQDIPPAARGQYSLNSLRDLFPRSPRRSASRSRPTRPRGSAGSG